MRQGLVAVAVTVIVCACGGPAAAPVGSSSAPPPSGTLPPKPSITQSVPPMTRASWSADRVGTDVKVAFHNLDGHPVSLLLFDPDGRRVAQIPIAGSGIWGPESCVAQIDSKGQGVGMIGETTMTSPQFSAFESRWRAYTVRMWGDPGSPANAGAVIALEDSGCRAIRQTTP